MGSPARCARDGSAATVSAPPRHRAAGSSRREKMPCLASSSSARSRAPASSREDDLAKIAETSNDAVDSLGVPYTWVKSYVAGDKIYCVHEAEDAETILEHARRGGFPADWCRRWRDRVRAGDGDRDAETSCPGSSSESASSTVLPLTPWSARRARAARARGRRSPATRAPGSPPCSRRLCWPPPPASGCSGELRPASDPAAARPVPRHRAAASLGPLLRDEDMQLPEVCEQVYDALRTEPTVLVVEDLHWVDAASVEVLRFLARRVEAMPLALVVTYRDHEIGPRHSARPCSATSPGSTASPRSSSRRCRVDGVRSWWTAPTWTPSGCTRSPAATRSSSPRWPRIRSGRCPASVRDAVLARTVEVDARGLRGAAAGRDRPGPARRPGAAGARRSTCPRCGGWTAPGLLARTAAGWSSATSWRGRPWRAPSRPAAARGCTPGSSRRWSGSSRATLRCSPTTPSRPATGRAPRRTPRGRRARPIARRRRTPRPRRSSQTALEHLDGAPPGERAELLPQLGYEQYMTSRLDEAIDNVTRDLPAVARGR